MTSSFAVAVHREHHGAAGVAMQQDAVDVATLRDAPERRYAAGVDFGVGDVLGLLGQPAQSFANVPDGRQPEVRVAQPILSGSQHLGQMVRLLACHNSLLVAGADIAQHRDGLSASLSCIAIAHEP
jgi:hypothetical protein